MRADCEGRKPGCHDRCEKYLGERAKLNNLKRQARLANEAEAYTREMVAKRKNDLAKRNKDRGVPKWRRGG